MRAEGRWENQVADRQGRRVPALVARSRQFQNLVRHGQVVESSEQRARAPVEASVAVLECPVQECPVQESLELAYLVLEPRERVAARACQEGGRVDRVAAGRRQSFAGL